MLKSPNSAGINFGNTVTDYAEHRAGFPSAILDRVRPYGLGMPGQKVLDIGTGTGCLARLFACAGAEVLGVDASANMIAQARRLTSQENVSLEFRVGFAEQTGLAGETFDVVTAGQCWHWFDRPRAAAEVWRVLKPGGYILVCHFDWLPSPGNVIEATESLILKHNPRWDMGGGDGQYPKWLEDLSGAGFTGLETFSEDHVVQYTHAGWLGRVRASAGVAASLSSKAVTAFDEEHRSMLSHGFPQPNLGIPHRLWGVIGRRPG